MVGKTNVGSNKAKWELLWTNPSPTEQFQPQTLNIGKGYNNICIEVKGRNNATSTSALYDPAYVVGSKDGTFGSNNIPMPSVWQQNATYGYPSMRSATINEDNIVIGSGIMNNATNNSASIPLRIWGMK